MRRCAERDFRGQRFHAFARPGYLRLFRDDLDVDLATRVILDLWSATLRLWVMERASFGLAEELDRKLGILIQGMAKA